MTASSSSASVISAPVTVRCKGVLFDMDGILISSLGSVERSWRTWGLARGIDPTTAIHTAHGCRAIETIRKLRPDLDDEAELKFIEDLEIADKEGLAVLPGVLDLLAALPAYRWTVVTSATERLARVRMAAGGIPVPKHITTADHVTNGKPHPEPYLRGAEILELDPRDCVVFEDSASGTKAGRAAGCTVIGTTFSHSVEELSAAHYLVTDLTGIKVELAPEDQTILLHFVPLAI
ncbi:HAD family hydrolase [Acidicapsa acidisoli]|uniref:HAD family hydrolase n=1 Tax=Acidicapsa acidisoli TaxID=1615681 RepID=UPI0021E05F07|nr:HAD family hydrolase [Acidicapsa acidisoli]